MLTFPSTLPLHSLPKCKILLADDIKKHPKPRPPPRDSILRLYHFTANAKILHDSCSKVEVLNSQFFLQFLLMRTKCVKQLQNINTYKVSGPEILCHTFHELANELSLVLNVLFGQSVSCEAGYVAYFTAITITWDSKIIFTQQFVHDSCWYC